MTMSSSSIGGADVPRYAGAWRVSLFIVKRSIFVLYGRESFGYCDGAVADACSADNAGSVSEVEFFVPPPRWGASHVMTRPITSKNFIVVFHTCIMRT